MHGCLYLFKHGWLALWGFARLESGISFLLINLHPPRRDSAGVAIREMCNWLWFNVRCSMGE